MPLSNKPKTSLSGKSSLEKIQAYKAASSPVLLTNATIDYLKELAASLVTASTAYGQIITFEQNDILHGNISLDLRFSNNTNATLTNESITQEQGNAVVAVVNAILLSNPDELDDILEDLELPITEEDEGPIAFELWP